MQWVGYIVAAVAGYLLGSIPTGYLVGRARGVDIRQAGSGNIGATNALRVLGRPAGIVVLCGDALKGWVACVLVARAVLAWCFSAAGSGTPARESLALISGVAAILGHMFSCWLGFKGGKGIATTGGVYLGLAPVATLLTVGVWGGVLALSRYVSLASLAAAVALPLLVWWRNGTPLLSIITALLGLLAIYKHKGNVQRLLHGTEHRLGEKKDPATPEVKAT